MQHVKKITAIKGREANVRSSVNCQSHSFLFMTEQIFSVVWNTVGKARAAFVLTCGDAEWRPEITVGASVSLYSSCTVVLVVDP
jgi:hypothetical protein